MLLIKNAFNSKSIRENKAAFAELPGAGSTAPAKAKAADTLEVLASSVATRDGLYQPNKRSKSDAAKAQKVAAAAFSELPAQGSVAQPKAMPVAVEDILADSLPTREGFTAGPSLGSKIFAAFANAKQKLLGLVGTVTGAAVGLGKALRNAAKAVSGFVASSLQKNAAATPALLGCAQAPAYSSSKDSLSGEKKSEDFTSLLAGQYRQSFA